MTGHAYSEDQLVEQPAIGLFAELGWQTVSAMEEAFLPPSPLPAPIKGEGVYWGAKRRARWCWFLEGFSSGSNGKLP
jgi:type I restriction enzyme R subunit